MNTIELPKILETRWYNSPKGYVYQVNIRLGGHFEIIEPDPIGTHFESDILWMHAYYPEIMNDLIDCPIEK
jgi:hypothetical protein